MSKISNYIENLYTSISKNGKRHDISQESVDTAITVLKTLSVIDVNSLFYYLSAINLLNAAIKMNHYKKLLKYEFIKGKARAITEYVIAKNQYHDVKYHYSKIDHCLYVEVLDVVFSFHYVDETPFIINVASTTNPINWTGIRLQILAEDIFHKAQELYENKFEDF